MYLSSIIAIIASNAHFKMCLAPPRLQSKKVVIMGGLGVGKYSLYKLISNDIVSVKDSDHSAAYINDFSKIELP